VTWVRRTRAPENREARGLSPTASSVRPKGRRIIAATATATTTSTSSDHGSWSMPGMPSIPPRPSSRKDSDSAPVGAPPVNSRMAPNRTSIMPSVVMNDGTRR